ncbi:MAG TPA: NAD(P)-dependent oxidoreductase [Sphingobium sp.]|uniref:NAD(P)-dependent oxidoreductase n=1 Tax=Sphingobium sp. TaxID=1912891 RepID=UPI002ED223D2
MCTRRKSRRRVDLTGKVYTLISALAGDSIAGAFLDTASPEPLPPEDPLWSAPNCLHSMHLSGRSQTGMIQRAARLFLDNLQT